MHFLKFLILILSVSLIQNRAKTILFFGDSLTAGFGLSSPTNAFPAQMENELNKKGKRVKVINGGLSGETSSGGLSRIDWVLRQPIDVFVLELGSNDGLLSLQLNQ